MAGKPISVCGMKRAFCSKAEARDFAKKNKLRLIAYTCPFGIHAHLAHRRHAKR